MTIQYAPTNLHTEPQSRPQTLPAPQPLWRRIDKHPALMHYNRLIVLVLAVNAAILVWGRISGGRRPASISSPSRLW
ncbi:MAG: hypothetical protein R2856_12625 [Caldilineaceae bacterium]